MHRIPLWAVGPLLIIGAFSGGGFTGVEMAFGLGLGVVLTLVFTVPAACYAFDKPSPLELVQDRCSQGTRRRGSSAEIGAGTVATQLSVDRFAHLNMADRRRREAHGARAAGDWDLGNTLDAEAARLTEGAAELAAKSAEVLGAARAADRQFQSGDSLPKSDQPTAQTILARAATSGSSPARTGTTGVVESDLSRQAPPDPCQIDEAARLAERRAQSVLERMEAFRSVGLLTPQLRGAFYAAISAARRGDDATWQAAIGKVEAALPAGTTHGLS